MFNNKNRAMPKSLPHTKYQLFAVVVAAVLLTSCGSYQSASYYDDDGIYASSDNAPRTTTEQEEPRPVRTQRAQRNNDSDVYQDYFGQQAEEYAETLKASKTEVYKFCQRRQRMAM